MQSMTYLDQSNDETSEGVDKQTLEWPFRDAKVKQSKEEESTPRAYGDSAP